MLAASVGTSVLQRGQAVLLFLTVHTGSPVEAPAHGQVAAGYRTVSPVSWGPPVGALWLLHYWDRQLQAFQRLKHLGVWTSTAGQQPRQTCRLFSTSRHSHSPVSPCPTQCDISVEICIVPKLLNTRTSQPLEASYLAENVVQPGVYSLPFLWGPRGGWTGLD